MGIELKPLDAAFTFQHASGGVTVEFKQETVRVELWWGYGWNTEYPRGDMKPTLANAKWLAVKSIRKWLPELKAMVYWKKEWC